MTIAPPNSTRDKLALSSLVHGLAELGSVAIARFVQADGKNPVLLLLAPFIEPEIEGLIDVELPFQEDLRSYRFPPLDHVLTITGTVLSKHRHLPTEDLSKAMDAYVDRMSLCTAGVDEDGNPTEYLTLDENYRPDLHRISQGIRYKAAWPDKPIPPIPDILVKYRFPPSELIEASKSQLEKLISAADVKKVPAKSKGSGTTTFPKSGLDITALLAPRQATGKITPENCIPEFKQALRTTTTGLTGLTNAVSQFTTIIKNKISAPAFVDRDYAGVIKLLSVLKEEMIEYEEPGTYNRFMVELKREVLGGKLGGDRRDFWAEVGRKWNGLGLVVGDGEGEVEEGVAAEVLSLRVGAGE